MNHITKARRSAIVGAIALVSAAAVYACQPISVVAIDDGADTGPGAPAPTADATPAPADAARADAAPAPADAARPDASDAGDLDTSDAADLDAGDAGDPDAGDAGDPDASDAGGRIPVVEGPDGVLRGNVGGSVTHSWIGHMRTTNPGCPPGARIYTSAGVQCCSWSGDLRAVTNIPVTFDLATGAGTLAGAPIGPLNRLVDDPDGTMRFRVPTVLHSDKSWNGSVAMATLVAVAPPAKIAEARDFLTLGVVRAVPDSLRNVTATWHPVTKLFTLRSDLITFQATTTGTCTTGAPASSAMLLLDLRGH